MSSHPVLPSLSAAGGFSGSSRLQSIPRRIADGVISAVGTNLRVSLELVTQRPASRSYVIRYAGATMTHTASAIRHRDQGMPTSELDWSPEKAKAIRHGLSSWVEDWDDPALDVYNIYLQG